MNDTNFLRAKPETSGTSKQKCLCWRFKEIYVAYFGPHQESKRVGVCVPQTSAVAEQA